MSDEVEPRRPAFVTAPPKALFCPICHDVFSDCVISDCSHSFDRMCLYQAISHGLDCPLCRKPINAQAIQPNLVVQNLIEELRVFCPFREQGCQEIVQYGGLEIHASKCAFKRKECPHRRHGCTWSPGVESGSLVDHLRVCPYEALKVFIGRKEDEVAELKATVQAQAMELEMLRADVVQKAAPENPSNANVVEREPQVSWINPDAVTCRHTLSGHKRAVTALFVGQQYLYSGSQDCTVMVWDLTSFATVATLAGHRFTVWGVVELGGHVYTVSSDGNICVWSTEDFGDMAIEDHMPVVSVAAHPNGKIYALDACHLNDRDLLFTAGSDCCIKVWHRCLEQGLVFEDVVEEAHSNTITCLRVSTGDPVGDMLLSASHDYSVKIWKVPDMQCVREVPLDGKVYSLALRGRMCFAGVEYAIKALDLRSFDTVATLTGHRWEIWQLAMAGGFLVSGSFDHQIKLWDPQSYACVGTLRGHRGYVHALASHGTFLFSASGDRTIKVWSSQRTPEATTI